VTSDQLVLVKWVGDHRNHQRPERESSELHKRQLRSNQLDTRKSGQQIKDLTINIRYKEQLIKQLLRTGHEVERISEQRAAQVVALEAEKTSALNDPPVTLTSGITSTSSMQK
jgi:hypothetical protein